MLTGSEIRRKFLDYFVQHGHKEVHSSPLVPQNDLIAIKLRWTFRL